MKNQHPLLKIGLLSLLLVSVVVVAQAQLWQRQTPNFLLGSDIGLEFCQFGYSVSLSADGNTALIGAQNLKVNNNSYQGAAYIYTRTGGVWTQKQKLVSMFGTGDDTFGTSVSLSADGRLALVGAPQRTNLRGGKFCIYANRNGTWVQVTELRSVDIVTYDDFGDKVLLAADNKTAAISAPQKPFGSPPTAGRGVCYVVTYTNDSTWALQQALKPSDPKGNDLFGSSISFSNDGNTLLIGSPGYQIGVNGQGMSTGKAYIFTRLNNVWTEQARLIASDYRESDFFGNDVSLSGDGKTAIIGAYQKTVGGKAWQGKAYFFSLVNNVWTEQYNTASPNGAADQFFGSGVMLSTDGYTAVVGATQVSDDKGKGYVFARTSNGWVLQSELSATDAPHRHNMGKSISMSANGNTVLLGANYNGGGIGGAHVFSRTPNAVSDTKNESLVQVYPTLVNESVTIKWFKADKECVIDIINNMGQVVETHKAQGTCTLDTRHFAKGLYIVSVRDTEGGITTSKIIKN